MFCCVWTVGFTSYYLIAMYLFHVTYQPYLLLLDLESELLLQVLGLGLLYQKTIQIMVTSPKNKKRAPSSNNRATEIALLEQLSSRLDTYTGGPPTNLFTLSLHPLQTKSMMIKSKSILAAKELAKSIAKACVEVNISTTSQTSHKSSSISVFDSLIEEYRLEYPTLTKKMIIDGIARYKKETNREEEGNDSNDQDEDNNSDTNIIGHADYDLQFSQCMEIISGEMQIYWDRVESIKKRRASTSLSPKPKKKRTSYAKGSNSDPMNKTKRGRPRKNTPDMKLMIAITEKYAREREEGCLPNGRFATLVEEVKKEMGMEDFDMPLKKINKRVTWHYMSWPDKKKVATKEVRKHLTEEVYKRYERAKKSNGGVIGVGEGKSIIDGVKLELGLTDVELNYSSLEQMARSRFRKENPDFEPSFKSIKEKEMKENPIDRELVKLVTNELGKGKSVTRVQGLIMAGKLVRSMKEKGADNEIVLDAAWWRGFIERNQHKLVA